jgi:hypothetical protein
VRQVAGLLPVAALAMLAACGTAEAEVFILTNGGRVEGELLNPDELPRQKYAVRTAVGAEITLTPDQVEEVVYRRPEQVEYEAMRHTCPDTVEGQWKLAEWCRERQLLSERETHLRRILELEPDNLQARRALGYSRVGDKWMTQEERMISEGYRRYKGRWRTQQEIDLMEKDRRKEDAIGEWKKKVSQWRDWLGTDRHRLARENIVAIKDPNAINALAYALQDDPRDQARLLYIDALARIGTSGANRILAIWAMQDPIEEVRLTCLDYLREKKDPETTEYFISKLRSASNAEVNRAAKGLNSLGDPAAVGPLIDAVVTVHKYKVTSGSPGQTTTTFGSGGPGGLSVGSSTKIISQQLPNRDVLDALVTLSGGVNFGFDKGRWKAWYASQRTRPDMDARRD